VVALNNTVIPNDPEVKKYKDLIIMICRGNICSSAMKYLLSFVYMDDNYKT
jgi:hypothetical protein